MFGQKSDFYLFVGIFRAFLISSLIVIVCPNRVKPREDWTQSIELVSFLVCFSPVNWSRAASAPLGAGFSNRAERFERRRRALGHWEEEQEEQKEQEEGTGTLLGGYQEARIRFSLRTKSIFERGENERQS